jgi:hypothetical protein
MLICLFSSFVLHAQYFRGMAEYFSQKALYKITEKVEGDSKEKMNNMKDEDGVIIFKQYAYLPTR